jgi:hypothetical protein
MTTAEDYSPNAFVVDLEDQGRLLLVREEFVRLAAISSRNAPAPIILGRCLGRTSPE